MIEQLFRVMLKIAPRDFRERFGDEMLATARALDCERPRRPPAILRAIGDAVLLPFSLRAEMRREARRLAPSSTGASMDLWLGDLRLAARGLRREPGFTAFVCVTLAFGIGANAAMFGIADRLLLRGPDHVVDPARVVRLYSTEQPPGMRAFTTNGFGYVSYALLKEGARSFADVATCAINSGVAGQGAGARPIKIGYASAGLFRVLGVQAAARGRFFTAQEDATDAAVRVAVLSHGAWTEWFGAADDALGRTLIVGDEPFTVIGVAPRGFTGPQLGRVDVWVPASLLGARVTADWTRSWHAQWTEIIARLAPGVTFEQAGQDATAVHRRGYTGGDPTAAQARLTVASLRANEAGLEATEVRVLRWLIGVAALVLLIACANVANLMLARGVRRGREIAIRAALGAGRMRIARLLIIEAILLALGGAALGLLGSAVIGRVARDVLFAAVEWTTPPVDWRVVASSTIIAVATGLLIGVVPAARAMHATLTDALRSGAREGGGRRSRLRGALTVVQAALSVVLLVGAGLFVRSLWHVRTLDLGIDPDLVLVVDVNRASLASFPAGPPRDAERARRRAFFLEALGRVRGVPGVTHASVATGMPFGNRFSVRLRIPGSETLPTLRTGGPSISAVEPAYFETIGTAILRGRSFLPGEGAGTEPVAIVSETMAQTLWPGRDPIGACLLIGDGAPPCARVVGVAENTHRGRLQEDPVMHYYIPAGQETRLGFGGAVLLVRGSVAAADLAPEVRRLLTSLDATIGYVTAETIQERIDPQMRPWIVGATVFVLSGGLALLVAAIGIYSVMSYLIADRRREIGVRLALGATTSAIVGLVLRGSVLMAVAGVIVGETIAVLLGGFVEPLLFRTSPREPVVLVGVGALLVGVALAATLRPAQQARRVSAVEALRTE